MESPAKTNGAFSILSKAGLKRENIFLETEGLVRCASKHNGVVFGGYVRDVIVPTTQLGYTLDQVDFKDMDFWFTSKDDANAFIAENNLVLDEQNKPTNEVGYYPVDKNTHFLMLGIELYVLCDIMICDFYPVCDFSVNLLSWDGTNLTVNKPYDIIAQFSRKMLEVAAQYTAPTTPTYYTCEEFIGLLQKYKLERFTVDDVIRVCNEIKDPECNPRTFNPTESDKEVLQSLADHHYEFGKLYTLEEVIFQIKYHKYDICAPFVNMSQYSPLHCFDNVKDFVRNRIRQFRQKFVDSHNKQGTY